METARVRLYKLRKCGFYEPGSKWPVFGSFNEIMRDLLQWINQGNRNLIQTCTSMDSNEEDEFESLKTLCCGLHRIDESDYILVTWNETPSVDGKTSSIQEFSPVNNPEITEQAIAEHHIPGYATYFYIMSNLEAYTTIQFNNPLNGNQKMLKYIESYMKYHSSFRRRKKTNSGQVIDCYVHSSNKALIARFPKFSASLFNDMKSKPFLQHHIGEIRKIITKTLIDTKEEADLTFMQKVFSYIGIQPKSEDHVYVNLLKCEIDFHPSKSDLNSILDKWSSDPHDDREDIGFQLKNDPKVYWLSHHNVSFKIDLKVERFNNQQVDFEQLGKAAQKYIRPEVIAALGAGENHEGLAKIHS